MKHIVIALTAATLLAACGQSHSFVAEEQVPGPTLDTVEGSQFGTQTQAVAGSKPFHLQKYGPYDSSGTVNTNRSTSDWAAATVVGVRTFSGDIQENGSGKPFYAYPFKQNGTWRVTFDIRSHNNHEGWEVWVMFIDHSMATVSGF